MGEVPVSIATPVAAVASVVALPSAACVTSATSDAIAVGVEHAVEGGIHLDSSGVHAVIDGVAAVAHGAEAAVHAVAVDLPTAIASDVADVTNAALGNATTLATAATGVAMLTGTSPIKMIGAMF